MTVYIVKLKDEWPLSLARTIVKMHFDDRDFSNSTDQQYQDAVAVCQDHINSRAIGGLIAWQIRDEIKQYVGRKILLQASSYLRAARPGNDSEVVGWHRESMYGGPPGAWNIWMPVANVNEQNTLRYLPNTEKLPDEALYFAGDEPMAEKDSPGHRIGLLYAPKRITGGVDFSTAEPMIVPLGSAALFPGSLIHGAGINRSKDIRFSVDVRLVPQVC